MTEIGVEANDLQELVAGCEELMRDTSMPSVRSWKERTGGVAIGFMPTYVPRELMHAQGVLPVGIMGSGDIEIIRGDAYYQSYICHIPRSTVELGLNGSLDCLDGMIFPAICDVIRNLSGMWKLMFPEKLVHYLDVPRTSTSKWAARSTATSWRRCRGSSSVLVPSRSRRRPCARRFACSTRTVDVCALSTTCVAASRGVFRRPNFTWSFAPAW